MSCNSISHRKICLLACLYATCLSQGNGFSRANSWSTTSASVAAGNSRRPPRRRLIPNTIASSMVSKNLEPESVVNGEEGCRANTGASSGSLFWPSDRKRREGKNRVHRADHNSHYDNIFDSIVKVYATHNAEPDLTMPWQKCHSSTSYSSGFVIGDRRILTNAHSVEYAGQVLVRRRGSSKKHRATIEIVANECDLAVLSIEDDTFWRLPMDYSDNEEENTQHDGEGEEGFLSDVSGQKDKRDDAILPLEFGELPELQDQVEVLGYPTGGDSLSVTKGIVSRIEATEYAQCSGSTLLAIQIDAAINGGNSGGPVVDAAGRVVGVAFQSLDQAENIGYVVPVTVVLHFLEDIRRHGRYSGVTCLGIRFTALENEAMRSYLKLPKDDGVYRGRHTKKRDRGVARGGVMILSCLPTCPANDVLRENDVILSIDNIPVASDGNIPFRRNGRERVSFASYVQTKFANEAVTLELWRDGGPVRAEVPLAISKNLVPAHWDNLAPPYLIVGGFVFSALSVPYLEDCGAWGDYVSDNLSYLVNKVNDPLEQEGDQVVFLINVLAHPKNAGYDGMENMQLLTVNETKVRSLKHLQQLLKAEEDKGDKQEKYMRFKFGSSLGGGGTLVVLKTNSLHEIEKDVCEEHSIQNSCYFPQPSS